MSHNQPRLHSTRHPLIAPDFLSERPALKYILKDTWLALADLLLLIGGDDFTQGSKKSPGLQTAKHADGEREHGT